MKVNTDKHWDTILSITEYYRDNPIKVFYTGILTVVSFILFLTFSAPFYALDILTGGQVLFGLGELYWLLKETSGMVGVVLTMVYSVLFAIIMIVSYSQIRRYNRGFKNTLSVIPAIIFSGCAGCGTGVIALLGAAGLTSIVPFGGNLLRVFGVFMMIGLLLYIGDPRED